MLLDKLPTGPCLVSKDQIVLRLPSDRLLVEAGGNATLALLDGVGMNALVGSSSTTGSSPSFESELTGRIGWWHDHDVVHRPGS